jgi:NAD-dependent dihydropyrimidine dehydrogenase PreA subunit
MVLVNRPACTGCGVCVETCPPDVLRLDADQKAYAHYPNDCQGCLLCAIDCPRQAVMLAYPETARRQAE